MNHVAETIVTGAATITIGARYHGDGMTGSAMNDRSMIAFPPIQRRAKEVTLYVFLYKKKSREAQSMAPRTRIFASKIARKKRGSFFA